MQTRILVAEDDPTVSEIVSRYLAHEGHCVEVVADGVTALARAQADPPHLVVLDVMLPGLDGLEVCRRLRARSPVPVVLLTALGTESDRVAGLEIGADDYVTKPFSPRELTLRVRAVLRRGVDGVAGGGVLQDGELRVDKGARQAHLHGEPLALTTREFDLLTFMLANPGRAFSRRELLSHVWDWEFGDFSTVTVHIRRLREKIEDDPASPSGIVTVWGVGYRYVPRAAS